MEGTSDHIDIWSASKNDDIESIEKSVRANPSLIFLVDEDKRTALHWAAAKNRINALKLLCSLGANINHQDETKWTPLMSAASAGHEGVVKALLAYDGIDVSLKNDQNRLALHYACSKNHENIVRELIEARSPINISDIVGSTPLHRASTVGNQNIAKMLIKAGAKVNTTDNHGDTSLHLACIENHFDMVKMLLMNGADTSIQNHDKQTAYELCRNEGMINILKESDGT